MIWSLILSAVLLGLSLAMDAFAVSICNGMIYRGMKKRQEIIIPLTFGVFQAVMPIIGFYIGWAFGQIDAFDDVDHWIGFALLVIIGGKMIFDGIKELRENEEGEECEPKKFSLLTVLLQGVATSIDALFVGFTLNASLSDSVTKVQLWAWISVLIIGVITFCISIIGLFLGKKFGQLFKRKASVAEIIGGCVLLLLAVKLVLQGYEIINF